MGIHVCVYICVTIIVVNLRCMLYMSLGVSGVSCIMSHCCEVQSCLHRICMVTSDKDSDS